jgi:hypothetical protein
LTNQAPGRQIRWATTWPEFPEFPGQNFRNLQKPPAPILEDRAGECVQLAEPWCHPAIRTAARGHARAHEGQDHGSSFFTRKASASWRVVPGALTICISAVRSR